MSLRDCLTNAGVSAEEVDVFVRRAEYLQQERELASVEEAFLSMIPDLKSEIVSDLQSIQNQLNIPTQTQPADAETPTEETPAEQPTPTAEVPEGTENIEEGEQPAAAPAQQPPTPTPEADTGDTAGDAGVVESATSPQEWSETRRQDGFDITVEEVKVGGGRPSYLTARFNPTEEQVESGEAAQVLEDLVQFATLRGVRVSIPLIDPALLTPDLRNKLQSLGFEAQGDSGFPSWKWSPAARSTPSTQRLEPGRLEGQDLVPGQPQHTVRTGAEEAEYRETQRSKPKGRRAVNDPVSESRKVANKYRLEKGLPIPEDRLVTSLDKDHQKLIAEEFEKLEHAPNDPEVQAAYEALAAETLDQYDMLLEAGITVEIYQGEGEPYASSQEMIDDVRDNKHLFILSTSKEFGQTAITNQQRSENPLLRDSGLADVNGTPLLINDVFRAVHDYFGHTVRGNSFGAVGEENAWEEHVTMFSPLAARAMTTETRGQNSWVNFGPQMQNEQGVLRKRGEEGYLSPRERAFAPQKIGLLPAWISTPDFMAEQRAAAETQQAEMEGVLSTMPNSDYASEQEILEALSGDFAMLSADVEGLSDFDLEEQRQLAMLWFRDNGLSFIQIAGRYGNTEFSFLVPNMTREQALEFMELYDQEAVAMHDGLVFSDGTVIPPSGAPMVRSNNVFVGDNFSVIKLQDGTPVRVEQPYGEAPTAPQEGQPVQGEALPVEITAPDNTVGTYYADVGGTRFRLFRKWKKGKNRWILQDEFGDEIDIFDDLVEARDTLSTLEYQQNTLQLAAPVQAAQATQTSTAETIEVLGAATPFPDTAEEGQRLVHRLTEDDPRPLEFEFGYVDPNDIEYSETELTEEQVLAMRSTQEYIEFYERGEVPPAIRTSRDENGELVSLDRRRVVAARAAGVERIPAWIQVDSAPASQPTTTADLTPEATETPQSPIPGTEDMILNDQVQESEIQVGDVVQWDGTPYHVEKKDKNGKLTLREDLANPRSAKVTNVKVSDREFEGRLEQPLNPEPVQVPISTPPVTVGNKTFTVVDGRYKDADGKLPSPAESREIRRQLLTIRETKKGRHTRITAEQLEGQVARVTAALSEIIPGLKIEVLSGAEYKQRTGKTGRGYYDGAGTIYINADKATTTTLFHEAAHAAILAWARVDSPHVTGIHQAIKAVLERKGSTAAEKALAAELQTYIENYENRDQDGTFVDVRAHEFFAELVGFLSANKVTLNKVTGAKRIAKAIDDFLEKTLGIRLFSSGDPTKSINDIIDFVNTLSNSFAEGTAVVAPDFLQDAGGGDADIQGFEAVDPTRRSSFVSPDIDPASPTRVGTPLNARQVRGEDAPSTVTQENWRRKPDSYAKHAYSLVSSTFLFGPSLQAELMQQWEDANAAYLEKKGTPGEQSARLKLVAISKRIYDEGKSRMAANLRYFVDRYPQEYKDVAALWYNGANRMAQWLADTHGITLEQASAVIAGFSPNNDWFNNIAQAFRYLQFYAEQDSIVVDNSLLEPMARAVEDKYKGKRSKKALANKAIELSKVNSIADQYRGKTLAEVDDLGTKADLFYWLFKKTPRDYDVFLPTGQVAGLRVTKDNKSDSIAKPQSQENVIKMFRILEGDSPSDVFGPNHKVRSFYNNIVAPGGVTDDVTVDTHAAAAALMLPMSGSHDFLQKYIFTKPQGVAEKVNQSQLYGLVSDAYRQIAQEEGLPAHAVQSIVWEAVKGLFTESFKKQQKTTPTIEAAWKSFSGELSDLKKLQDEIYDIAGGFTPPYWFRLLDPEHAKVRNSNNPKVVPRDGDGGAESGGSVGGRTGDASGLVPGAPEGGFEQIEEGDILAEATIEDIAALNPVYTALFLAPDVQVSLEKEFPPVHPNTYYHHTTFQFRPEDLTGIPEIGKYRPISIIGRLTTDDVDVLVVEKGPQGNPVHDNPHITLSTAEGVSPVASNQALLEFQDQIQYFDKPKRVYAVQGFFNGKRDITSLTEPAPRDIVNKVEFSGEYPAEANDAIAFATERHGDQQRKFTGLPYTSHLEAVASKVAEYTDDIDTIRAAILHDVVEDTDTLLEDVRARFGDKVADIVSDLTDVYTKENFPDLNRVERKEREAERIAAASPEAKLIKAADQLHNIQDIYANDPSFAERYLIEARHIADSIAQDTDLFRTLDQKITEFQELLLSEPTRRPIREITGTSLFRRVNAKIRRDQLRKQRKAGRPERTVEGHTVAYHASDVLLERLDESKIKGGARAVYGHGVYFTTSVHKALDYGDKVTAIDLTTLNLLNTREAVTQEFVDRMQRTVDRLKQTDIVGRGQGFTTTLPSDGDILGESFWNLDKLNSITEVFQAITDSFKKHVDTGSDIDNARKALDSDIVTFNSTAFSALLDFMGYDGVHNGYEVVVHNMDNGTESLLGEYNPEGFEQIDEPTPDLTPIEASRSLLPNLDEDADAEILREFGMNPDGSPLSDDDQQAVADNKAAQQKKPTKKTSTRRSRSNPKDDAPKQRTAPIDGDTVTIKINKKDRDLVFRDGKWRNASTGLPLRTQSLQDRASKSWLEEQKQPAFVRRTREQYNSREQLVEVLKQTGMGDTQIAATLAIFDRVAKRWAERTGKSADRFWVERLASVVFLEDPDTLSDEVLYSRVVDRPDLYAEAVANHIANLKNIRENEGLSETAKLLLDNRIEKLEKGLNEFAPHALEKAIRETREGDILFSKEGDIIKGATQLLSDGSAIMYLTTSADVSTPMHELVHIFEQDLTPEERAALEAWAGEGKTPTEISEMFAAGAERYFLEGPDGPTYKNSSKEMQGVFDKFKQWLTDIYDGLSNWLGSQLELNDDMRNIYAAMFGPEDTQYSKKKQQQAQRKVEEWIEADAMKMNNLSLETIREAFGLAKGETLFHGININDLIELASKTGLDDPASAVAYALAFNERYTAGEDVLIRPHKQLAMMAAYVKLYRLGREMQEKIANGEDVAANEEYLMQVSEWMSTLRGTLELVGSISGQSLGLRSQLIPLFLTTPLTAEFILRKRVLEPLRARGKSLSKKQRQAARDEIASIFEKITEAEAELTALTDKAGKQDAALRKVLAEEVMKIIKANKLGKYMKGFTVPRKKAERAVAKSKAVKNVKAMLDKMDPKDVLFSAQFDASQREYLLRLKELIAYVVKDEGLDSLTELVTALRRYDSRITTNAVQTALITSSATLKNKAISRIQSDIAKIRREAATVDAFERLLIEAAEAIQNNEKLSASKLQSIQEAIYLMEKWAADDLDDDITATAKAGTAVATLSSIYDSILEYQRLRGPVAEASEKLQESFIGYLSKASKLRQDARTTQEREKAYTELTAYLESIGKEAEKKETNNHLRRKIKEFKKHVADAAAAENINDQTFHINKAISIMADIADGKYAPPDIGEISSMEDAAVEAANQFRVAKRLDNLNKRIGDMIALQNRIANGEEVTMEDIVHPIRKPVVNKEIIRKQRQLLALRTALEDTIEARTASGFFDRFTKAVAGVFSASVNMVLSLDTSFLIIHALPAYGMSVFKPRTWKDGSRSFVALVRTMLGGQNQFDRFDTEMRSDPFFEMAVSHGLRISDLDTALGFNEGYFVSNVLERWLNFQLPAVMGGRTVPFGKALKAVRRWNERNYAIFLNTYRYMLAKEFYRTRMQSNNGFSVDDFEQNREAAEAYMRFINDMTGGFKNATDLDSKMAKWLITAGSGVLISPRLYWSQFRALGHMSLAGEAIARSVHVGAAKRKARTSGDVRDEYKVNALNDVYRQRMVDSALSLAWMGMLGFGLPIAAMAALSGGDEEEFDRRLSEFLDVENSNFMKVRVGTKAYGVYPLRSPMRLVVQILRRIFLEDAEPDTNPMYKADVLGLSGTYAQYRLNPPISATLNFLQNKDFLGRQVGPHKFSKENISAFFTNMFVPILAQDVVPPVVNAISTLSWDPIRKSNISLADMALNFLGVQVTNFDNPIMDYQVQKWLDENKSAPYKIYNPSRGRVDDRRFNINVDYPDGMKDKFIRSQYKDAVRENLGRWLADQVRNGDPSPKAVAKQQEKIEKELWREFRSQYKLDN